MFQHKKKYLTVLAAFTIMLCIGSVYSWSLIATELIENYNFSATQSQIVFGTLIATFPITMIFAGRLSKHLKFKTLGYICGLLFFGGYYLASISQGNFLMVLMGIGVLAGIATGIGYSISLTLPVQFFPKKKGLVTGIAAAGFGLGAVFMSGIAEKILSNGNTVWQLLQIVGILYGLIIIGISNFMYQNPNTQSISQTPIRTHEFVKNPIFKKLIVGIFLGTFAGLMIIGNLKLIGQQIQISDHILVIGVSIFASANFLGRLVWGSLSDYIDSDLAVFFALFLQSIAIILFNTNILTEQSFLAIAFLTGFTFGGNFVLFVKQTALVFGIANLGIIYPYVFLGYAVAGIIGPLSGAILFDYAGSFYHAIFVASTLSLAGSLMFLKQFISKQKSKQHHLQ